MSAQLLNDASEVAMKVRQENPPAQDGVTQETLSLTLPIQKPNVTIPVIELFMKK